LLQSEINALKRACLYSLPANKLGYCGPPESWRQFEQFLSDPTEKNAATAKSLLKEFCALYPYLELIASANNLLPFDPEVVEAYWLGNSLLENVQYFELQETLLSFQRSGLPRSIAEEKAAELPDGILPHHSFHVLYVNFISPKVKPIVSNLSNCLVQWATVQGTAKNRVKVKGIGLFLESNELKLRERAKVVQNPLGLGLNGNNLVSVHWDTAVECISAEQARNLRKYTEQTLAAIQA